MPWILTIRHSLSYYDLTLGSYAGPLYPHLRILGVRATLGKYVTMSTTGETEPTSGLGPTRRRSLGEDVADQLREAILHGDFLPGEHLREEDLANRLQVSRGPVRSAFVLLERQGLVRSSHHRGVIVAEFSQTDLYEVYTLRSAIEPLAVRLAIRRGADEDFAMLQQRYVNLTTLFSQQKITEHGAAQLDLEFHDAIFEAAHHDRLLQAWSQIRLATYKFLLSRNVANPDWHEVTLSGHKQILDVIVGRDEVTAVDLIGQHIEEAYNRVLKAYVQTDDGSQEGPTAPPSSWPFGRTT
jgi:DNA-binding GntR family transcriptional regulator